MATRAPAVPFRATFIAIAALSTLGLGIATAARIEPVDRLNLLLASAVCVAMTTAVANGRPSRERSLAAGMTATAAAIVLAGNLWDIKATALDALVWSLIPASIVSYASNRKMLAQRALIPCAALAFALPTLAVGVESSSPSEAVRLLAASAACLAFGVTFCLGTATGNAPGSGSSPAALSRKGRSALPRGALWGAAGLSAIAATLSTDQVWTVGTLCLLTTALLVEHIGPKSLSMPTDERLPGQFSLAIALIAVICASALAIASIAAGYPFGWAVFGVAVTALGTLVALGYGTYGENARVTTLLRRAASESQVDPLTGLANRRALDARLHEEIARAVRFGHPLALLMIDIDDFKQVNDRLGHAAGDATLRSLAEVIRQSIRSIDIAARFGGEEFVVVLPETGIDGAAVVAERIRSSVAGWSNIAAVSVSIGVAELNKLDSSPAPLLLRADEALYRAKRFGKNRVELAR